MTTGYQIKEQSELHYLTLQVVEWVDIFTRIIYKEIIIDSLKFCQKNKGLQIFGYVIMTNHIHLIANSVDGCLSDTLRDFKRFTSNKILKEIQENTQESRKDWMLKVFQNKAIQHSRNEKYQFWTHENHAIHLYTPKFTWKKLEYIHNNPVRAGIVQYPEHYLFSSARNYAELDSSIDVIILDRIVKTY
ncbi:MAG: transposase [Bacteroidales bacterium]|nr:transposase [Bacteroidales bacterium]